MATREARRTNILDAAEALMLAHGPRATSMAAIAARAGIAKPTLYAHFGDKPTIVAALGDRLRAEIRAACAAGLAGDGDLPQRVGAALAGARKTLWRRRALSPHADALFAGPIQTAEAEMATVVAAALADLPRAYALARLLLAATAGLAAAAATAAELGPAIRLLAERLLRPEPTPPKGH